MQRPHARGSQMADNAATSLLHGRTESRSSSKDEAVFYRVLADSGIKNKRAIVILMALAMARIVVGAVFFNDCALQKMVPVHLIVSGCSHIVFLSIGCLAKEDGRQIAAVVGLLFRLAWMIAGSVWIYPTWKIAILDQWLVGNQVPCLGKVTTHCHASCQHVLVNWAFCALSLHWIIEGVKIGYVVYKVYRETKAAK